MFTPPPDHLRPIEISVPKHVAESCIKDAAFFFGIDPDITRTIFYDNEGGKIGTFSRNDNGTYDIGPAQINSGGLKEINTKFPRVTWQVLAYDACASYWVGTWWLYKKIQARKGNVFEGVGDYNSRTPTVRAKYIINFMNAYNKRLVESGRLDYVAKW